MSEHIRILYDGKLALTNVLAGCPTATIVACLLPELAKRVAYVIESKEELQEKLGTSTDKADAVITAWFNRKRAMLRMVTATAESRTVAPLRSPLARWR